MNRSKKCIAIIDKALPLGLIANTAAILGCTLGQKVQGIVGEDIVDQCGRRQPGIINIPLPILTAEKDRIREIYRTVQTAYADEIEMISFSDVAQRCKDYEDYKGKMAAVDGEALDYLGLCLYGEKKEINHLTGNLPTLK